MTSVAVLSRSFSKNNFLRNKLIEKYPNAIFNDSGKTLKDLELINFLKDHEKAIVALEVINESILSQLPNLKLISKYGVGLNMLDLYAMKKFNIQLAWKGGLNKRSVSELVLSASISLLHRSVLANSEVKKNKWYQIKGRQLSKCTIGIIGCGNIGKDLVKLLKPFECKILVNDIIEYSEFYKSHGVISVDLNYLLSNSDIITLHVPLNDSTKNILNKEKIKLIKKESILINYARGGLIDENFLEESLRKNHISGAALDVFENEPPTNNSLFNLDNVLVTPHIGGSTNEAILAMGMSAIDGLDDGENPLNFINL